MMNHTATVLDLAAQSSDTLAGCAAAVAVLVAGWSLVAADRLRLRPIPVPSRARPRR